MELLSAGEDKIIEDRKDKFLSYFKKNNLWIYLLVAILIAYAAFHLRVSNLSGLRDVATGEWTLGPDLDPFLFLRWAEYIVDHGSLMPVDTLRYVPLGYETNQELILLPYMIAWFHRIASSIGLSSSIAQSGVIFPAYMFFFTVIAFFFLVRKIFLESLGEKQASIIALISSFFLSFIPSLLPRTIAGIPEKESTAFLFMFLAFYFFICSWKSSAANKRYSFSVLAGISTAAMALIWGGVAYVMATISIAFLICFLLGQADTKKLQVYGIWLASSFILMHPFSSRYSFYNLFSSTITGFAVGVFLVALFHLLIHNQRLKPYFDKLSFKGLSSQVNSLIIVSVLGAILLTLVFGFNFISSNIKSIKSALITPVTSRLGVTVAENKQPFFDEWAGNFGPVFHNFPVFFWFFFIGSVLLFYHLVKEFNKRERWALTISYLVFLICLVFSRYRPDSVFNGTNTSSILLYSFGVLTLIGTFGYYYYKSHKASEEHKLKSLDFGIILLFSLFFFSIVSARGAVRVILVLVPSASIMGSYFIVSSLSRAFKANEETIKLFSWAVAIVIVIASLYSANYLYSASSSTASNYVPNEYTHQWQYAMAWVRENTSENAVFAHWWDYGYWVQSIGKRATVLDGGNQYEYWDYLMGRHGLTSPSEQDALDFLYSHNTTHFLIDSTDIGKYSAFSSIGSDEHSDRASWLPFFVKDNQQVKETKNGTSYIYTGSTPLDQNIIYEQNGTRINLPSGSAGLGGIILEFNSLGDIIKQPVGAFIYQNKRYDLPLRYAYVKGKFTDFGSGIESGVYVMPQLIQNNDQFYLDKEGTLIYLSNKTVKSQLARLYLYKEDSQYFKLVHSEDDIIIKQLKKNNMSSDEIIFFGGLRGPIRIWEINYPEGMEVNQEYLRTTYPNDNLRKAL